MADAHKAPDDAVHYVLDGRPAEAHPGEMVISAAERAGTYIPRFCYHPRMKPVGMCRMCLVEVSGPRGATLQPSCYIPVTEGMEVSTTSEKVRKAQEGVLEFLLVNHPLDCPVCDKGGECPLQDQTIAHGPGETRFVEEKRHFEKPIALSDLVLLDRERCIQCGRCTRFAAEIAGEALIDFSGRGDQVEVATFPTEPFSSYFSGNTVQICPVGALTATPYRFTARPWDLDQVESTCTTCAVGCRVVVQSSANRLTRILGIDSSPVNQGWLCDKGRFVFEAVNGDEVAAGPAPAGNGAAPPPLRPRGQFAGEVAEDGVAAHGRIVDPMVRRGGELVAVGWGEALAAAAAGIHAARAAGGPGSVAVLGGARCTNEDAYAWAKLAKSVIGTDSVDAQLGDGLPADLLLSLPRATIDQAGAARVVVLLTGDVREELPVLFLRLRDAAVSGATRLLELTSAPTSLTGYASASLTMRPGDAPDLVRALGGDSAALAHLRAHPEGPAVDEDALAGARTLLGTAGDVPAAGEGVVVVLGRPSLAEGADVVAEAALALSALLPGARFLPAVRRGNVHGALDMGLAPGILPGRVSLEAGREWFGAAWGKVPAQAGRDALGILGSLAGVAGDPADGAEELPPVRALVLVGADPLVDFPDHRLADSALSGAAFVVAVAGHHGPAASRADVVLPAAVAHERPGTTTNLEGRVTRCGHKLVPPGRAWPDWMIAAELAVALGGDLGVESAPALSEEIAQLAPAYAGLTLAVHDAPGSRDGLVVPLAGPLDPSAQVEPIDPTALPGVEAVERQGAPPRVGSAAASLGWGTAPGAAVLAPPAPGEAPARPAVGAGLSPARSPRNSHVPSPDSYSLRLVAPRKLYDAGSAVGGSPSLAGLVPAMELAANPYDLDRLGVADGEALRVRSAHGALVLAVRSDPAVARGVAVVGFNLPGPDGQANGAATLIDATAPVNEIRLESL